tara:strand:- start:35 stop:499 length:465 start_codon:yes stop_codon:yes gene_type:complete
MTIAPASKSIGRPSHVALPLSPKCKQALTLKAQGKSWKERGSRLSCLQDFEGMGKKNPDVQEFLLIQEDEAQEQLNEGYQILIGFAPEAAEKLIELIRSPRTRDYVRKDAIRDYFQIIEKGKTERQQAQLMQEMLHKLSALEDGAMIKKMGMSF